MIEHPQRYYIHTEQATGTTHAVIYLKSGLMYLCGQGIDAETMIKTGYNHDIDCETCRQLIETLKSKTHD